MQIDVLKELLRASEGLSEVIIHQTPGQNGVTRADFDALVSRRDRITVAINSLIGQGFKPGADLDGACSQLKEQNDALDKAAKAVDVVKKAIDVGGQVIAAAAKVVAFFV